jgi:uncharacterized protein (DUF302 family)
MMAGIRRELSIGFDQALAKLPDVLRAEGFGVLTEIDVAATLSAKLGVQFRRYRILGACNPSLAHRALGITLDIGVMLPCNVVVYERDDGNATVVAIDPMQTIAGQDAGLAVLASEVRERLSRVVDAM